MDTDSLREYLKRRAELLGSRQALAQELDISPQYLCDILMGRREPGDRVIKALGMVRRIEYVKEVSL